VWSVRRLDIAMDDPERVRLCEGLARLQYEIDDSADRQL
jgi:hypothetical protein